MAAWRVRRDTVSGFSDSREKDRNRKWGEVGMEWNGIGEMAVVSGLGGKGMRDGLKAEGQK